MSPQMLNKHARTKGAPCDVQADGSRLFDVDELREWMTTTGSVKANGSNRAGAFAGGGGTALELQMELKREQIRELQLANDTREGKLIDAEEAERAWSAQLMVVRNAMDAMPSRLASKLSAALQLPVEKAETIIEAVRAEVVHVCRGLSGQDNGVEPAIRRP